MWVYGGEAGGGRERGTFGRKSILSSVRILSGVTASKAPVSAGALLQTQHGPARGRKKHMTMVYEGAAEGWYRSWGCQEEGSTLRCWCARSSWLRRRGD